VFEQFPEKTEEKNILNDIKNIANIVNEQLPEVNLNDIKNIANDNINNLKNMANEINMKNITNEINNLKNIACEVNGYILNEVGNIKNEVNDFINNKIPKLDIGYVEDQFTFYQDKALSCLKSLDENVIQKGREYLMQMLVIVPNHANTLYNLACAESLLKRFPEAIDALEKAVENGFVNLNNLMQDKELDFIRNTEAFNKIVEKMKVMIGLEDKKVDCYEVDKKVLDDRNNALTESFVDLRNKWTDKLIEIKNMGFLVDDEVISLLLEQYHGDTEKVINLLV